MAGSERLNITDSQATNRPCQHPHCRRQVFWAHEHGGNSYEVLDFWLPQQATETDDFIGYARFVEGRSDGCGVPIFAHQNRRAEGISLALFPLLFQVLGNEFTLANLAVEVRQLDIAFALMRGGRQLVHGTFNAFEYSLRH